MKKKLYQKAFEAELMQQHRGMKIYRYKWPNSPRSTFYYDVPKPTWFTKALGIWTSRKQYEFGESRVCVSK